MNKNSTVLMTATEVYKLF